MNRSNFHYLCLFVIVMLASCSHNKKSSSESGAKIYKGTLNVAVDQSLAPVIKLQQEVFEYFYDSIQLNLSFENEQQMFADFKSKKSTVMILARPLTQPEIENLKKNDTIYVSQFFVAYDAVALIANKNFDDSNLDTAVLKKYFSPQDTSSTMPRLVFGNQSSSVVRYVLDYLGYKEKISPNVFAMKSTDEVINYVSTNENSIGFIPYNVISDTQNEQTKSVMEKIKILSLRAIAKNGETIRVSANQSDIITGDYPLIRTVNVVTRYTHDDNLESLFFKFLGDRKGEKIFLRAGLVPVKMYERDIIVNESKAIGSK